MSDPMTLCSSPALETHSLSELPEDLQLQFFAFFVAQDGGNMAMASRCFNIVHSFTKLPLHLTHKPIKAILRAHPDDPAAKIRQLASKHILVEIDTSAWAVVQPSSRAWYLDGPEMVRAGGEEVPLGRVVRQALVEAAVSHASSLQRLVLKETYHGAHDMSNASNSPSRIKNDTHFPCVCVCDLDYPHLLVLKKALFTHAHNFTFSNTNTATNSLDATQRTNARKAMRAMLPNGVWEFSSQHKHITALWADDGTPLPDTDQSTEGGPTRFRRTSGLRWSTTPARDTTVASAAAVDVNTWMSRMPLRVEKKTVFKQRAAFRAEVVEEESASSGSESSSNDSFVSLSE